MFRQDRYVLISGFTGSDDLPYDTRESIRTRRQCCVMCSEDEACAAVKYFDDRSQCSLFSATNQATTCSNGCSLWVCSS